MGWPWTAIENRMDPGPPLDKGHLRPLAPKNLPACHRLPGSLEDALDALARDHQFLLKGDVFTEELIGTYIQYKANEGSGCDPAAPASVRVRHVLRHLQPDQ